MRKIESLTYKRWNKMWRLWKRKKLDSPYDINVKIVNAISSYCTGKMPKREHGWYLPNDD